MKKATKFFGKLGIYIINFLNIIFDGSLSEFKADYEQVVDGILPEKANRDEIHQHYFNLKELYYKHKDDRRYIFYTYLVLIPPMFVGIFYLKEKRNELFANILDIFTMLFTIVTIFMFSMYRRKILKKALQIIAFQKKYSYLPNDFIVTSGFSYSKGGGLMNQHLSTTNLYRVVVVAVLLGLLVLLFI
jgi:hypothetical protein